MPETSPPPGRQHEDALIEHLGDIVAELRELGTALPSVNDPELHKRLEQLVALAPRMEEAHGTAPRQDIAEALMGLRDATRALHVPARDPELGATPTLRRVREGKGLIIAAIDDALAAAAVLGWQPIHPPALHEQPVMLSRETQEAEIEVLTLRLDKVEASLSTLDKARTEPTNFVQQVGLLNVYVPSMRVEVDLARLHLTIGEQTVDLGALARAVEAMGELTQGFTATVRGWMNDVSDSVKLGARAIRDAVSRRVSG